MARDEIGSILGAWRTSVSLGSPRIDRSHRAIGSSFICRRIERETPARTPRKEKSRSDRADFVSEIDRADFMREDDRADFTYQIDPPID
jgi:hypothetical protein